MFSSQTLQGYLYFFICAFHYVAHMPRQFCQICSRQSRIGPTSEQKNGVSDRVHMRSGLTVELPQSAKDNDDIHDSVDNGDAEANDEDDEEEEEEGESKEQTEYVRKSLETLLQQQFTPQVSNITLTN